MPCRVLFRLCSPPSTCTRTHASSANAFVAPTFCPLPPTMAMAPETAAVAHALRLRLCSGATHPAGLGHGRASASFSVLCTSTTTILPFVEFVRIWVCTVPAVGANRGTGCSCGSARGRPGCAGCSRASRVVAPDRGRGRVVGSRQAEERLPRAGAGRARARGRGVQGRGAGCARARTRWPCPWIQCRWGPRAKVSRPKCAPLRGPLERLESSSMAAGPTASDST